MNSLATPDRRKAEWDPSLSDGARESFLKREGRPFLLADWSKALFLHYEIAPGTLQPFVPFQLDTRDGHAFASLVAFTMRGMRFARGGGLARWVCVPLREQRFLNLRTYVRHEDDAGIFFMREWMSHWLCVQLGPPLYGLPYRRARLNFEPDLESSFLRREIIGRGPTGRFACEAQLAENEGPSWLACEPGTLDEWLLERYSAFTEHNGTRRSFRIWHQPWLQTSAHVSRLDESLLARTASWWQEARFIGANYSPGVSNVWMGWPRRVCVPDA